MQTRTMLIYTLLILSLLLPYPALAGDVPDGNGGGIMFVDPLDVQVLEQHELYLPCVVVPEVWR